MVAPQDPYHHGHACRPDESLSDHLRCLPKGLIPMPDDGTHRVLQKVVALILVVVWAVVFLALTFDAVAATRPEYWALYTAIVFTLVGKLWDLEVAKYLPTNTSGKSDSEK